MTAQYHVFKSLERVAALAPIVEVDRVGGGARQSFGDLKGDSCVAIDVLSQLLGLLRGVLVEVWLLIGWMLGLEVGRLR